MGTNSELDRAIENRNEAYYSFCDKLMTLSTGAIALSVTFKSSIVQPSADYIWLLITSWSFFTLTIISALFIHWGNAWIWNRRANEIFKDLSSNGRLPKIYSFIRWFMLFAFIAAIITFVLFAIINVEPPPRRL